MARKKKVEDVEINGDASVNEPSSIHDGTLYTYVNKESGVSQQATQREYEGALKGQGFIEQKDAAHVNDDREPVDPEDLGSPTPEPDKTVEEQEQEPDEEDEEEPDEDEEYLDDDNEEYLDEDEEYLEEDDQEESNS